MSTLVARLREALAGDSLDGLDLAAVARRLPALPLARVRELFHEHMDAERELVQGGETAKADDVAAAEAAARKAAAHGKPARIEYPIHGEACKAFVQRWRGRCQEYGLPRTTGETGGPGDVLRVIRERIKLLSDDLCRRYRENEPRELAELKAEHSRAVAAMWECSNELIAARRGRNERGGTLGSVSEQPILDIVARQSDADAKREALRRRLWSEWGADVRGW